MSTVNARRFSSRFPALSARRRARRPNLEALEDRTLLTTFVVNNTSNVLNPGPGVVTLRSAIQQANSQPDAVNGNLIQLPTGTYTLSLGTLAILPSGGNLTIQAAKNAVVTIDGGSNDRVFDINPVADPSSSPGFFIAIDGLTIQNGKTTSTDAVAGSGAGIRVQGSAALSLTNDILKNNTSAANGGGVAVLNGTSFVSGLAIQNCQFLTNTATAGSGGGIYAPGNGVLSSIGSTLIQGNMAHDGGGIENPGSNLSLLGVTLDSNQAVGGNGGGLDVTNPSGLGSVQVRLVQSLFTNNAANAGSGGAIRHAVGSLIDLNSQFAGNHAGTGGAISSSGLTLNINGDTFKSNSTTVGDGGALAFSDTGTSAGGNDSQVINSTFTMNTAASRGGAIADAGPGDLTLVNDTINANTSGTAGGGIALPVGLPSVTLKVQNTILFGNHGATGPDVATPNGPVSDLGGNLVGTLNQGNSGFLAGTLTVNPLLGPLADNGGPDVGFSTSGLLPYQRVIQTEALALNSPAIGKGVVSTLYLDDGGHGVDQRGFARPVTSSRPSIGAIEPQQRFSIDYVIQSDSKLYTRPLDTGPLASSAGPFGNYSLLATPKTVIDLAVTRFGTGLAAGVETFAIGSDNQIYSQTIDPSNNPSGFVQTVGGKIKSFAVGTGPNGNPTMFAVSTDDDGNQLYYLPFDAQGKSTSTKGAFSKAAFGNFKTVVLSHDASGNPLLYGISSDADFNQVYGMKLQADGTPYPLGTANGKVFKVGGLLNVKELVVGHDANNNPKIFVSTASGGLFYHQFDAVGVPAGSSFIGLGGPLTSISVTSDPSNRPIVFGIGGDGNLYERKFDANGNPNGNFTGVNKAVPGNALSVYAGTGASGNPELFAISKTNLQVYVAAFDPNGNNPSAFSLVSPGKAYQVKKLALA